MSEGRKRDAFQAGIQARHLPRDSPPTFTGTFLLQTDRLAHLLSMSPASPDMCACTPGGQVRDMEAMRVSFAVPYRCEFGQHIALVGSDEYLGDWDALRAKPMNWTNGDVWTVDLDLPPM